MRARDFPCKELNASGIWRTARLPLTSGPAGHTRTHAHNNYGDRSHIKRKRGVWFVKVSALTCYPVDASSAPLSRGGRSEAPRRWCAAAPHTPRSTLLQCW